MVIVSIEVEFFFSLPHRSVIVSFKILPKILSLFPHSNNSSDSSKLLKWAIKELDLMECFFDNLKDFSSSCLQAKSSSGGDIIAEREQQIQARLDFITALFSNEMTPDHFRKFFTIRLSYTNFTCPFLNTLSHFFSLFFELINSNVAKHDFMKSSSLEGVCRVAGSVFVCFL